MKCKKNGIKHLLPKYPEFACIERRLNSFKNCQKCDDKYKNFVLDGFFFQNAEIKCFHCGLNHTIYADNEHQKSCWFLRNKRKTYNFTKKQVINSPDEKAILKQNIDDCIFSVFQTRNYNIIKIEFDKYDVIVDLKVFVTLLSTGKVLSNSNSYKRICSFTVKYDDQTITIKKKSLIIFKAKYTKICDIYSLIYDIINLV